MSWYFDLTEVLPPVAGDLIDTISETHMVDIEWQTVKRYSDADYITIIMAATDRVRDTDITFKHTTYRDGKIKASI